MPRGDHTGPMGLGPGTGKAYGYCYGFDSPGYTKGPGRGICREFGFGRGMGRGRGFGRGWGFGVPCQGYIPGYPSRSSMSREDEIKLLKSERLGELEKEE
jgi:hypothetical protein